MNCPACTNVTLTMSERMGVEIDYCPKCRGVWLDRGELDKLIDRAIADDDRDEGTPRATRPADRPSAPAAPHYPPPAPYPPQHDPNHDSKYGYHYKPHKKKNIWTELFDF